MSRMPSSSPAAPLSPIAAWRMSRSRSTSSRCRSRRRCARLATCRITSPNSGRTVRIFRARRRRAAALLSAGKKITILAGRGALGAHKELEEIAEVLGAPIAKPVLGKACVPDGSPYTTGGVGLLGTRASQEALEGCDTLLIVGSSFPYIEFYPKPGQARCVQIELDPQKIGLRYPAEVGLVGDSIRVLRRLIPLLDRNADRGWLDKARKAKDEWQKLMEERGTRRDMPMKPQVVAHELDKVLADNAIIATDSGT